VCFKPVPNVFSRFKIKKLTDKEKNELAQQKPSIQDHPVNSMKKVGIVSNSSVYVPPALRKGGGFCQSKLTLHLHLGAATAKPAVNAEQKAPAKEVSDSDKKARMLRKKLKEVQALQERADKGETLEKNQLAKLEKFDEMKAELDKIMSMKG
jgi:hypothetical protein